MRNEQERREIGDLSLFPFVDLELSSFSSPKSQIHASSWIQGRLAGGSPVSAEYTLAVHQTSARCRQNCSPDVLRILARCQLDCLPDIRRRILGGQLASFRRIQVKGRDFGFRSRILVWNFGTRSLTKISDLGTMGIPAYLDRSKTFILPIYLNLSIDNFCVRG